MADIFADGVSGWGAGIVAKGGGNMTDEELYRLYLAGDDAGLERLMERYGDALTLYIDGYLGDVHEAEDMKKNVKQITNMVYRGKQSLRALLEKEGISDAEQY